ncbi:SdpI family protein [Paraclostridium sordellii 8483]|uniref:SdpI family protein n=1 Tax=Paraclostridium sordellii TaxID=1505 RepID=UPI00031E83B9|nr:SdpI family protein [Paeniclostridium sordellii]TAN67946.1 SdpI family protein [Paeniclostridium sordellii 8483]
MYYFEHSYYLGILMIIVGLTMKYGAGEIPSSSGYKTWTSCKNGTNWVIANKYAGKLSIVCGFAYTIVFYCIDRFFTFENEVGLSLFVFVTVFVVIIIATEIHLYKNKKSY